MIRKFIFLFLVIPMSLLAQDDFGEILLKGNWMIGGNLALRYSQFDQLSEDLNNYDYSLQLKGGPFIGKGRVLGGKLHPHIVESDLEDYTSIFVGTFLRQYKPLGEYRWAFFTELEAGYTFYSLEVPVNEKSSGIGVGAYLGISEFITPTVSWEMSVGYRRSFFFNEDQLGQVGFLFGLQVFLIQDEE